MKTLLKYTLASLALTACVSTANAGMFSKCTEALGKHVPAADEVARDKKIENAIHCAITPKDLTGNKKFGTAMAANPMCNPGSLDDDDKEIYDAITGKHKNWDKACRAAKKKYPPKVAADEAPPADAE